MITLRPYQSEGVQGIQTEFRNRHRAVLYQLPTGGGKTVIFSYIAGKAYEKGNRVLIAMHRIELIRQTSKALQKFGVPHGIINPKFTPDPRQRIQVASIQTFASRLHNMRDDFDLIIMDECHHAISPTWMKLLDHCQKARILGVTATPIRSDGRGLGRQSGGVFDIMVEGPQIYELIRMGYLVEPEVYSIPLVDMTGAKVKMGDYDKSEVDARMNKKKIVGDVGDYYQKFADHKPGVIFCPSVKYAEMVAEEFRGAGYRAYSVDGTMDDETRGRLIYGLETGETEILTSCDLISEGTDIPAIEYAGLLRPTLSTGLYIQQVGRALRTSDGKHRAIIVDHVGNVMEHMPPDIHRDWSLDGVIKRKSATQQEKEQRLRECEMCYRPYLPAPACPYCGHVNAKKIAEGPERVQGELVRITADMFSNRREQFKSDLGPSLRNAKTLDDFKAIGDFYGYKKNWAYIQFNLKQKKEKAK